MKTNLNKAQKLRKAIEAKISDGIDNLSLNIEFSAFEDVGTLSAAIEAGTETLRVEIESTKSLIDILGRLRNSIASANSSADIDAVMTKKACLERARNLFKKISERSVTQSETVILAKIERYKNDNNSFRSDEEIDISTIGEALKRSAAESLRDVEREISALEDERIEKNASTFIEIAEEDVAVLRNVNIL